MVDLVEKERLARDAMGDVLAWSISISDFQFASFFDMHNLTSQNRNILNGRLIDRSEHGRLIA